MSLTVKKVQKLLSKGKRGQWLDERCLYLVVTGPGTGSWSFQYELAGHPHEMGLGSVADVQIDEARELARQARVLKKRGIDPLTAKREEIAANRAAHSTTKTFAQAADDYFAAHAEKWKDGRHRKQIIKSVGDYTGKILGPLSVDKIETRHVIEVLEQPVPEYRQYPAGQFWTVRAKTARSTRERIETILDFATVRGWRRKEDNPARWKGHLNTVFVDTLPKAQHHPALAYQEVPQLMIELRSNFTTQRRALEFTILTAVRTDETLGATWDEVDFDAKVWTIPKERMKATRPHIVPLSDRALELLRDMPRAKDNSVIFAGNGRTGKLSARSLASLLADLRDNCTVHGMRSSFRDWAGEQTATPPDVVEHCLAHRVGNTTERSYARSTLLEKRRQLMNVWSRYCCSPVMDAEIVPLKSVRK